MGVRSQVQLNVIYADTGVREMKWERETETRTETIKYFRINATRWLLLIKCQNRQHQILVWRLKISIITGWKSFTALPALFAWRSYLCIWVTFLTGAGKQNHINTSDISVCSLCACNCAVVPIRNVQINMNFRATVDKPNDRTAQGVRGEGRGKASQTSRRTRESQNFLTSKVGHTDDLHDLKTARERDEL